MAKMKSAPGPTEIPNWQSQIIKTNTTVSNNAAVNTGTSSPVAVELYNMDKRQRQQIALALKNAGYRVPTNGVFSDSLLKAYSDALQSAQLQAAQLGQQFSSTFFTNYLTNEAMAYGAGTGAGGPKKTVQARISDPTSAKALIDIIIQDQNGRKATADEVKKYTTALQKAQKAAPVITTYTTKGGVTTSQTTGGINEQQYLIDKIAGTDEAKANKVLSLYETAMKVLAGE